MRIRMGLPVAVATALLVAVSLSACGSSGGTTPSGSTGSGGAASPSGSGSNAAGPLPADAVIVYEYGDSSVPPEYHRSQTLTVSQQTATLVIDSYGDVLAEETADVPADVWAQLQAGYPAVRDLRPESAEGGCAGGTTRGVTVTSGGATLLDLGVEVCGGSGGAAADTVDSWIAPARALFPPTETLAPQGES